MSASTVTVFTFLKHRPTVIFLHHFVKAFIHFLLFVQSSIVAFNRIDIHVRNSVWC